MSNTPSTASDQAAVPDPRTSEEAPAAAAIPAVDPRLLVREQGFKGYVDEFKRKIRSGEIGSLPVVIGLVVIGIVFQALTGNFITSYNLDQITLYAVGPGIMAVGIVFVLLLGEIDLAVGSVAGLGGSVWGVLATDMPDSSPSSSASCPAPCSAPSTAWSSPRSASPPSSSPSRASSAGPVCRPG